MNGWYAGATVCFASALVMTSLVAMMYIAMFGRGKDRDSWAPFFAGLAVIQIVPVCALSCLCALVMYLMGQS